MNKILNFVLAFLLILVFSCTKNNSEVNYNANVQSAKDYIFAEDIFVEVLNMIFIGVNNDSVLAGITVHIDACEVTYFGSKNTILFDYGDYYIESPSDSKIRKGSFEAKFDGQVKQSGTAAVVNFDSLSVEEMVVDGDIVFSFLEPDEDMNPIYKYLISNGIVIIPDTVSPPILQFGCSWDIVWKEGWNTPDDPSDDLLYISGTATGVSRLGNTYNITNSDPVINRIYCNWLVSGVGMIEVPGSGIAAGTIDYISDDGDEGCNNRVNFYFDNNLFYDYYIIY